MPVLLLRFLIPGHRLQYAMPLGVDLPQEDALCVSTLLSQYLSWVFPRSQLFYERYLTFRDVPSEEVARWKEPFLTFAKKLSWKYGRSLLFKSPKHTCRIKLLLDIFPDARFVHIHRDPYQVFASSRHSYGPARDPYYLQVPDRLRRDDLIIARHQVLHDAFLEEREPIPKGRLHELPFADIEQTPMRELQRIYQGLGLRVQRGRASATSVH